MYSKDFYFTFRSQYWKLLIISQHPFLVYHLREEHKVVTKRCSRVIIAVFYSFVIIVMDLNAVCKCGMCLFFVSYPKLLPELHF